MHRKGPRLLSRAFLRPGQLPVLLSDIRGSVRLATVPLGYAGRPGNNWEQAAAICPDHRISTPAEIISVIFSRPVASQGQPCTGPSGRGSAGTSMSYSRRSPHPVCASAPTATPRPPNHRGSNKIGRALVGRAYARPNGARQTPRLKEDFRPTEQTAAKRKAAPALERLLIGYKIRAV